jgi:hypothetical protein
LVPALKAATAETASLRLEIASLQSQQSQNKDMEQLQASLAVAKVVFKI